MTTKFSNNNTTMVSALLLKPNNTITPGTSSSGITQVFDSNTNQYNNVDAYLELQGTDGGLLFNRMTTAQMNALNAVDGMKVYVTDGTTPGFYSRINGNWVAESAGGGGGISSVIATNPTNQIIVTTPLPGVASIALAPNCAFSGSPTTDGEFIGQSPIVPTAEYTNYRKKLKKSNSTVAFLAYAGDYVGNTGNVVVLGGNVQAGTGVTTSSGNIEANTGQLIAGTNIIAGNNITTANGKISGKSLVSDTTITAGTGITVTSGDITVSNGTINVNGAPIGTDALKIANNLSDLANVTTARNNLGLTNIATQTTVANNVLIGGTLDSIHSVQLAAGQILVGVTLGLPVAVTPANSSNIISTGGSGSVSFDLSNTVVAPGSLASTTTLAAGTTLTAGTGIILTSGNLVTGASSIVKTNTINPTTSTGKLTVGQSTGTVDLVGTAITINGSPLVGGGNVVGAATTTLNALAVWGNTTGTSLINSSFTVDANGHLSMNNKRITTVASPSAGTDVVNRDYVSSNAGFIDMVLLKTVGIGSGAFPAGATKAKITLIGGGGGGGGCTGYSGGGGGAGGAVIFYISFLSGTSYTYVVGNGATGQNGGGAVSNGGLTSITINGITYTAPGGTSGNLALGQNGGAGGLPVNPGSNVLNIQGGHGGAAGDGSSSPTAGSGGNSILGGGSGSSVNSTGTTGYSGAPNSGGGGSGSSNGSYPGGNGGSGLIIIEY